MSSDNPDDFDLEHFSISYSYDGPQINPMPRHVDKLISSPCKKRPDTGEPCLLKDYDKNNNICPCGFITGKKSEIPSQNKCFNIIFGVKKINACKFPECNERAVANGYCLKCNNTLRHRTRAYKKKFGNDVIPPVEYMMRPKKKRKLKG